MKILIVGQSCTGKTTAKEYFERRYDFVGYDSSYVIQQAMEKFGMVGDLEGIFGLRGETFVAEDICADITERTNDDEGVADEDAAEDLAVAIAGFRRPCLVDYMRGVYDTVCVVGIRSPIETMFQRNQMRKGRGFPDMDAFQAHLAQDNGYGLGEILENYIDIDINNDGDLNTFYNKLDEVGEL